jgi:hypothetical protein
LRQCSLCSLCGAFIRSLEAALIRSVMTCPPWEFTADNHFLKLQHLQNKVLRTIGNFPRCTLVCNMHMAFSVPYVYDYITKSCRQQAQVIPNYENDCVHSTGQGKARQKI